MQHNFKTFNTSTYSLSKHWLCICEKTDKEHLHNEAPLYVTCELNNKFGNTGHRAEVTKSLKCMVSVL